MANDPRFPDVVDKSSHYCREKNYTLWEDWMLALQRKADREKQS